MNIMCYKCSVPRLAGQSGRTAVHYIYNVHDIYSYDYMIMYCVFWVLVCYFTRPSSEALSKACRDGIEAMGGQVTDYG